VNVCGGQAVGETAAVLLSGGIDSACCAYLLKARPMPVGGIFVDYGQAAAKPEHRAATRVATELGIPLKTLEARGVKDFSSGELVGRNAFLIFSAIFLAQVHQGILAIGVHAGTPYFDCTPTFLSRMQVLAEEHTEGRLTVLAPFLTWEKPAIFKYFQDAGLPLNATYSCESGTTPPCGACASCQDRKLFVC
jgi:7-cyano-7-deazaguanine synthase